MVFDVMTEITLVAIAIIGVLMAIGATNTALLLQDIRNELSKIREEIREGENQ
jgi:mannose/fructose/N-acetylgalactosamine-specific phosphotransferase system component IIC